MHHLTHKSCLSLIILSLFIDLVDCDPRLNRFGPVISMVKIMADKRQCELALVGFEGEKNPNVYHYISTYDL